MKTSFPFLHPKSVFLEYKQKLGSCLMSVKESWIKMVFFSTSVGLEGFLLLFYFYL